MEIAVAYMADDRRQQPALGDVALGLRPRIRQAAKWEHRRRSPGYARRAAAPCTTAQLYGAPPTAGCAPPAAWPIRTGRRRTRSRSRRTAPTARRRWPRCREIPGTALASRAATAWNAIDRTHLQRIEQLDARHWNSGLDGQDGGTAARFHRGKRTPPPEMASGMPASFSVSSVMTPSVPSAPTISRVRS